MDLNGLQAVAAAVGPERWDAGPLPESVDPAHGWWGVGIVDDEMGFVAQVPAWEKDKAQYIAAADPQTVLQLVAIAKAAKEYQAGMFRPGSGDLTSAWTALCAALAGVE